VSQGAPDAAGLLRLGQTQRDGVGGPSSGACRPHRHRGGRSHHRTWRGRSRDGQQKVQYVYRNFPTGSSFGRKAVQYFIDIFKEASVSPKRIVQMYWNDLFGQNQRAASRRRHKRHPSWDIVECSVARAATDLSTEVSKARRRSRTHRADHAPGLRRSYYSRDPQQRSEMMGIVGPAAPGSTGRSAAQLKETSSTL